MKTYDQGINHQGFPTKHKHISNLCLPASKHVIETLIHYRSLNICMGNRPV